MENRLIQWVKINCYAFTIVSLVNECIYLMGGYDRKPSQTIELFIITSFVATLMLLIDDMPVKNGIIAFGVQVVVTEIGVIGLMFLFHKEHMTNNLIIANIIMIVVVHIMIAGIMFLESKQEAKQLNQKIERMRKLYSKL